MNGLVTEKRQYFRIVYFCLAEKIPRFSKKFVCPAEHHLGYSSLFGGKYMGQNSLFLTSLWVITYFVVEPPNSTKKDKFQ